MDPQYIAFKWAGKETFGSVAFRFHCVMLGLSERIVQLFMTRFQEFVPLTFDYKSFNFRVTRNHLVT